METINQNLMLKEAFDYAKKVKEVDRFTVAQAYLDGRKKCYKSAIDLANESASKSSYLTPHYIDAERKMLYGVGIVGLGEDFAVALHDLNERMTWDEACKHKAPSYKQAKIIYAVWDELNDMLETLGGDRLDDYVYRWTNAGGDGENAYMFNGGTGKLSEGYKSLKLSVRQVLT